MLIYFSDINQKSLIQLSAVMAELLLSEGDLSVFQVNVDFSKVAEIIKTYGRVSGMRNIREFE